jgi:predicted RNA-binding Zn-ribbon protein involved in translation (DUF1610 family)
VWNIFAMQTDVLIQPATVEYGCECKETKLAIQRENTRIPINELDGQTIHHQLQARRQSQPRGTAMSKEFKQICQSCGGDIACNESDAGQTIQCPHCGQKSILGRAPSGGEPEAQLSEGGQTLEPAAKGQRLVSTQNITALILSLLVVTVIGIGLSITAKHKTEKHRPEAEATKSAPAAKLETEAKARLEEERKARVNKNPTVWALWEEPEHETIQIINAQQFDASIKHKGTTFTVKNEDMPEWLKIATQTKYKEDGEAKGLIREIKGKVYDLRASPAGWVNLPKAEVIQMVEDGYLLVDVQSLAAPSARTKAFKLKQNGLNRILNKGDRIQLIAMSVGTYTNENERGEIQIVPVYDPGMPVGPLRRE